MNHLRVALICALLSLVAMAGWGQNEKKALKNADISLDYEEYEEAIPYLQEAIRYNPNNPRSRFLLGKCLYLTHQRKKAAAELEKAYRLDKEISPELPLYYAKSLHYIMEFDDAIVMYKTAQTFTKMDSPEYLKIQKRIGQCEYGKKMVANPVNAKIINAGPSINTRYREHSPVISADESVMFFTSVRPGNVGTKGGLSTTEDIYYTDRIGERTWSQPRNLGKNVNTKDHDASIGLSPDGQKLFIYKNPPGNGDIFECELKGTTWSRPRSLGPAVNTRYFEETVSISSDGKTIYFTSEKPGGLGETDIYTSTLDEDGNWSEAVNLGETINTSERDESPFIHPNGKTLYFSSRGHQTMGSYDIFKSQLQKDGTWSKPENLGYPINTPGDDIYFVISASGKHGYYSSMKEGGYGNSDIYMVDLSVPKPVVVAVTEDSEEVAPPVIVANPLTILKGKVTDAVTQDPVEATIQVIDNEKNEVISEFISNSATGKYLVSLPSGKNYGISVEADGYLFHSENFDIPATSDYQEITKDISLKKIQIGTSIVLRNIFFDHDQATLRKESVAELDRLIQLLEDLPRLKIEIAGHTDNSGSDSYNLKLSQRRAKSVVDFLIKKGIGQERLTAKGYGESKPIDTNETEEGKQKNRRTEFTILEN